MALKIRLTKAADPATSKELVFHQEVVTIGRGAANILTFPETLVSKLHARIAVEGDRYCLLDMRSTNGTTLNGERLIAERPYPVHKGDRVRITDYELEFLTVEVPPPPIAPDRQDVREPGGVKQGDLLVEKNAVIGLREPPHISRVDDVIEVRASLPSTPVVMPAPRGSDRESQLEERCEQLQAENRRLVEQLAGAEQRDREVMARPVQSAQHSDPDYLARTLLVLTGFLTKLAQGRSSFITEFFGFTMIQNRQELPAELSSGEKAAAYFADPTLTKQERDARLAKLTKTSNQLLVHAVGLLEGYRSSVDEGAREFLKRTDPETLKKDFEQKKLSLGPFQIPYRYLPFAVEWKTFRLVRQRQRDLMREDRGILEKRFFRPSFLRAYEACIASGVTHPEEKPDSSRSSAKPG